MATFAGVIKFRSMMDVRGFLAISGVCGLIAGILIFVVCFTVAWFDIKPGKYPIDHAGPRSFEPGMNRYARLVEFLVSLATGSIVLLAGSSVLRSGGRLPASYGSPLVLLAMSVVFSVSFLAIFIFCYEESLHGNPYTHHWYRIVTALGFSGLICFSVGYVWLGFALVRGSSPAIGS